MVLRQPYDNANSWHWTVAHKKATSQYAAPAPFKKWHSSSAPQYSLVKNQSYTDDMLFTFQVAFSFRSVHQEAHTDSSDNWTLTFWVACSSRSVHQELTADFLLGNGHITLPVPFGLPLSSRSTYISGGAHWSHSWFPISQITLLFWVAWSSRSVHQ
jgi:hypothetical protein